jgi:hypothetical protein
MVGQSAPITSARSAPRQYQRQHQGQQGATPAAPAAGTWGDGWTVWFWTWRQLVRGSALDRAVVAGREGSQFVSPSTLGPWSPSSPLQGPGPDSCHVG